MKTSILLLLLVACSQHKEPRPPTEQQIDKYFNLKAGKPVLPSLKNALAGQPIYAMVKDELDFSRTELKVSIAENLLIYMVPFRSKDRIYAVTAEKVKGLRIKEELLYSRKMIDDRNGTAGILKRGEAVLLTFTDGKTTIRTMEKSEYRTYFMNHGGQVGEFCQREKGETYGTCYQKESEEFCDGFFGCVAMATNPHINIIIAFSCTCYAKPVVKNPDEYYEPEPTFDLDSLKKSLDSLPLNIEP